MIHLFNKCYITYAETIVGPDAHHRLTDDYIQVIDKGLLEIGNSQHEKKRFFYAKNWGALFHELKSEEYFFEKLQDRLDYPDTNKIIIYADEKSMVEFLIRFWKGLFQDLTLEGLKFLFYSFSNSELLQLSKKRNYLNIAVDCSKIPYRFLSKMYWERSSAELEALYHLHPAFNLNQNIKEQCSVEFQLISYHLKECSKLEEILIKKFARLYQKAFVDEVCGIKRMIERNLGQLAANNKLPKDYPCIFSNEFLNKIESDSRLNFIRDEKITEGKHTYSYLQSQYDLHELCLKLIKFDIMINEHKGLSDDDFFKDNPIIGYFAKNKIHPDLKQLIKESLEIKNTQKLFKRMVEKNIYNPYIVPNYQSLKNQKIKNELSLLC